MRTREPPRTHSVGSRSTTSNPLRTRPCFGTPTATPFTLDNRFRGGDLVTDTVGVLGYDFSLYRIYPTAAAQYTPNNPRPESPADVGGSLHVGSMNTLNYFLTLDDWDSDSCGPNHDQDCRGADAPDAISQTSSPASGQAACRR